MMEPFLDTQSSPNHVLCFFCLQSSEMNRKNSDCDTTFLQVSLRNIFRYLESINPNCGKVTIPKSPTCFICERCTSLAFEFNELYHLMENIKLRLNWSLEKIKEVMTTTTRTTSSVNDKFQGDDLRANMIGQIRAMTPVPRVLLCKTELNLKQETISSSSSEEEEIDGNSDSESECASPDSHEGLSDASAPNDFDIDIAIKVEHDTDNSQEMEMLSQPNQVETLSRTKFKCSFCRAQFREAGSVTRKKAEIKLRNHVVHYHCESLFPSHKLDSVTDAQFKKIIGELLFKDLISENKDTFCVYCRRTFKAPTESRHIARFHAYVKGHFMSEHYEELAEKLGFIQSNPDLSDMLRQCNPNGKICECTMCGFKNAGLTGSAADFEPDLESPHE